MHFNIINCLKASLLCLLAAVSLSCSDLAKDLGDVADSGVSKYFVYSLNGFSERSISSFTMNHSTSKLTPLEVINVDTISPTEIAAHPSGRYMYFLYNSEKIDVYSIDSDGVLTATANSVSTGVSPSSLTVHPSGKFAYVTNAGVNTVSCYSISSSGTLTEVGSPVSTGNAPVALTVDPSGKFAYVTNAGGNTVSCYSISSSGTLKEIGSPVPTGNGPVKIAVHPSNKFAYVLNNGDKTVSSYSIDSSGTLTALGTPVSAGNAPYNITIAPSGKFLFAGGDEPKLFAYSISSTGELSPLNSGNPVITDSNYNKIAISFVPDSNFAYVVFSHNGPSVIDKAYSYTINSTGTLTAIVEPVEIGAWVQSLIIVKQ